MAQRNYALFDKILIANRGEIACRVMRTCKKMGIKTVAVYSEPDANALHVRSADEAVCIGPAPSSESYLVMERVIEAAKATGAQAVHPGYGFLSENMEFAKLLDENNITFIGPGSHAVDVMGDKLQSKIVAKEAGVNLVPGFLGEIATPEDACKIAQDIGYPVMLKAVHGGGGKGMRVAWNDAECEEGFRLSKQEAKASFGNDAMLVEKFIDNPRHIEIQVLADSFGKTVYLCERECSIQRRNQKVIEEAPSPFVSEAKRKEMGEQAVALAKAVQYKSAGTVEMLVDSQGGFYFLEMNTRLQVEHPITEYITGVDIVEQMIKVAAGERLELNQDEIKPNGWAFESRVYAEDPLRNFLPSIGRLKRYVEPPLEEGNVRCDTGVVEGSDISMYYDPLISKLCTYGETRDDAIAGMRRALDRYVIRGPGNNINFLRDVLENERFKKGDLSTKFIEEEYADGFHGHVYTEAELEDLVCIVSAMHFGKSLNKFEVEGKLPSAEFPNDGLAFISLPNGETVETQILDFDEGYCALKIGGENGKEVEFGFDWELHDPLFEATFEDGRNVVIQPRGEIANGYSLQHLGSEVQVQVWDSATNDLRKYMPVKEAKDLSKMIVSPMPGTVVSVDVKVGDKVFDGQELLVLEAMKMQNVLRAPKETTVKAVHIKQGNEVAVDEILIEFE